MRPAAKRSAARVLVVGASGFIGRQIAFALAREGCALSVHGRHLAPLRQLFPRARHHALELAQVRGPESWRPLLEGVDAAVMAAGIMGERAGSRYPQIHDRAACALFEACAAAGVRRVILISASGAGQPGSAYWETKAAGERCLERLGAAGAIVDWAVIRPSVVVGRGGASDGLFRGLAALPVLVGPKRDPGRLRPLHVADLAAAVAALVLRPGLARATLNAGGPERLKLVEVLRHYRASLGLAPTANLPVPLGLLAGLGWLAHRLGAPPPLDAEPVRLLALAPEVDPARLREVTGVAARPLGEALAGDAAARGDLAEARMVFLGLAARVALAVLWLGSGLVSLLPFARPTGPALLAEVGVTGGLAHLLLVGAAALDVAVGVALLVNWRPRLIGVAQLALIAAFTAILTLRAPVWWLHPFGPLLKNLPVLALVLVVMAREGR
jgi:nucleoside-diphosphate-sugar epimerase